MPIAGIEILHRTTEPLLHAEMPWEDYCIGWCTVLHDRGRWRMWYDAYDHTYRNDADGFLCYAESRDGVVWRRPQLDLVPHGDEKRTNILISGRAIGGVHGGTVFIDARAPAAERYKIVFSKSIGSEWHVYGAVSPDGLRWHVLPEALLARNSDTQSVCFRDGALYRLYVRMWDGGLYKGKRSVGYTESPVFGKFPDPEIILAPDAADPPNLHFYNSAASYLERGRYIMFPTGFYKGDDTAIPHLAASEDGRHFRRVGRQPVLALGQGFDSMGIYVSPGAIPAPERGAYWFYYTGTNAGHDAGGPQRTRFGGGVGRMCVRFV